MFSCLLLCFSYFDFGSHEETLSTNRNLIRTKRRVQEIILCVLCFYLWLVCNVSSLKCRMPTKSKQFSIRHLHLYFGFLNFFIFWAFGVWFNQTYVKHWNIETLKCLKCCAVINLNNGQFKYNDSIIAWYMI